jgi:hypothetical protein
MVKRVYVKKKPGFDVEAKGLLADLKENLQMENIENLVVLNRYDVSGISDEVLKAAKNTIFSEPPVDDMKKIMNLAKMTKYLELKLFQDNSTKEQIHFLNVYKLLQRVKDQLQKQLKYMSFLEI